MQGVGWNCREWGPLLAPEGWLLTLHWLNNIGAHQSFPGAVPEKPARLFSLSQPSLNTACPQAVAMPSGNLARETLFFSCPAHPDPLTLFPQGYLAVRSFRLWFSQRLRGCRAERCLRGQDPPRLNGSWQLSASQQQHKPTPLHPAHTRWRKASSLPFGSHLSSISYLHTSLPAAGWTNPIHLIFPHKPYLPPSSNHFICSLQDQKFVTEIQSQPFPKKSRQLLALFAGYLPVEG